MLPFAKICDIGHASWYDSVMSQTTSTRPADPAATITLTVPGCVADAVRTALEGVALEGYCSGALSVFQVQQLLGYHDGQQTQTWLGMHGAHQSYSLADLEADRATLDKLLGE